MNNSVKAIVFDLDGTLIDSVPDVRASLNHVLEGEGRRILSLDEVKETIGHGARATIERALQATGSAGTPDMVDALLERYMEFYRQDPVKYTVVYPGVVEVLERLREDGVVMGICSNKPGESVALVLEALGFNKFFAAVTCGDNVPYPKPDGRHILLTLEKMGAGTGADAVMVGDSETDIAAAIDAGVRSVAVTYGYAHVPYDDMGADVLIDRFADLAGALEKIHMRPVV